MVEVQKKRDKSGEEHLVFRNTSKAAKSGQPQSQKREKKVGKIEKPKELKPILSEEETKRQISRTLCWILRHGALQIGIDMAQNGWVFVADLLGNEQMKKYNLDCEKLALFVNEDKRRMFEYVCDQEGQPWIRARKGHTIQGIDPKL